MSSRGRKAYLVDRCLPHVANLFRAYCDLSAELAAHNVTYGEAAQLLHAIVREARRECDRTGRVWWRPDTPKGAVEPAPPDGGRPWPHWRRVLHHYLADVDVQHAWRAGIEPSDDGTRVGPDGRRSGGSW